MPAKINELVTFKFELGTADNPIVASFADPVAKKGRRVEGTASSTIVDSQGHELTHKALNKMAASAIGMAVFLNHEYDVPEDVFGYIEKAHVRKTSDLDPDGKPIYELRAGMGVYEANERAIKTHDMLVGDPERGIAPAKLGISIGAMIPEGGASVTKTRSKPHMLIDDVDLVEMSIVGVPSNSRSWIDMATKAFEGFEGGNLIQLAAKGLPDEDPLGDAAKDAVANEPEGTPDEETVAEKVEVTTEDLSRSFSKTEKAKTKGTDKALEGADTKLDDADEAVEAQEVETAGEASEATDKVADKTEKTRVSVWDGDKVIEVDTGRSRPKAGDDHSAQDEDPESAGGLPSGAKSTKAVGSDSKLVKSLMAQLDASRARLGEVEGERDVALELVRKTLDGTEAVITKLGQTPVGRRTNARDAEKDFDALKSEVGSFFDPEVQWLLKRPDRPQLTAGRK